MYAFYAYIYLGKITVNDRLQVVKNLLTMQQFLGIRCVDLAPYLKNENGISLAHLIIRGVVGLRWDRYDKERSSSEYFLWK